MENSSPTKDEILILINEHLKNELKWLFCSATLWNSSINSNNNYPPHFRVYCMDPCFLHARSLFEFFTGTNKRKEKLRQEFFGLSKPINSSFYESRREALHNHEIIERKTE